MVVIDLKNEVKQLAPAVRQCMLFLKQNGAEAISPGRHEIENRGMYVNVVEYTTKGENESIWEAHKKYEDLQVLLTGEEQVLVSNIAAMNIGEYHEDSDYFACDGPCGERVKLNKDQCVLLLPEDAHMPGVCLAGQPMQVKKAVFKIPVCYLVDDER